MNKKSDLFEVIHSLTKSEKRYFKVFSSLQAGQKNYLKLFDAIEKQKKTDEEELRKKLSGEPLARNIHVAKKYLFDLLLKSMRSYHAGKTIEGKIQDLFLDMEFLQNKGLIRSRDKILQKIKTLSNEHEQYDSALKALLKEWMYKADQAEMNIFIEHRKLTKKIMLAGKYRYLTHLARSLVKKGILRNENLKKEWDKIIRNPVLNIVPGGYYERHYYHQLLMLYNTRIKNFEKSSYHAMALLENIESRPDMLVENKIMYFGVLVNLISEQSQNNELEKAGEAMNKLLLIHDWNLNSMERTNLVTCTALSYCNLLAGLTTSGYINEGLKVAEQSQSYIKKNNPGTMHKLSLMLNLSIIYLISGNYKEALKWNVSLLNELPPDFREDVQALSRILNLIIHFELKNDELLPYLIRSTYRFLYSRKILYKTEEAILRFIRNKLPKANTGKRILDFFKELKTELEEITKDPYESKTLDSFDLIAWLDSKIQKRPFADIIREKALSKKQVGN